MLKLAREVRIWQWTLGLTVVHIAATAFLLGLLQLAQAAQQIHRMTGLDDHIPLDAAREILQIGLALLHMPLMAVEDWLPMSTPPTPAVLWSVLGSEALLQSAIVAVLLRGLLMPPKFFAVYRVPFVARPTVLLMLALAASHVFCSALLYLMVRLGGWKLSRVARHAFEVLHPTLGGGVFRPHGLAHADALAWIFLESVVWAFVTTAFIVVVRRTFFLHANATLAQSATR